MKYLLCAFLKESAAALVDPSGVHIVPAATSLSIAEIDLNDQPQLEQALRTALDELIPTAVAFEPTLVGLTEAKVIGEHLHVRLLIADAEGERALDEFAARDRHELALEPGAAPLRRTGKWRG